jgi:hypothetical protein
MSENKIIKVEEIQENTYIRISKESGHYSLAMQHIGNVLYYSPKDSTGLWIDKSVAEIIDGYDADNIREGFTLQVFNSRGVYMVDPTGKNERELAEMWRQKADAVENEGYIRFASSLKELAKSYEREAERVIDRFKIEQENEDNSIEDI